jgi:hypothetical protein
MASDIRIWTGSAWESIKGADGAPGPSVVSANAGQLAKLGTDNRVLVSSVDLDARYVNVAGGDTMTGPLQISYAAAQLVVGGTGNTTQTLRSTDNGNATLNISSGANTGQLVQTGTSFNFVNYASGGATSFSQAGNGQIRFFANSVQALTVSGTGIGVTGNITSTGTAHNLQPASILVNAISGLNADSLSDVTVTAPTAGQVLRWDGTKFVNAALSYADLTGSPPTPQRRFLSLSGNYTLSVADVDGTVCNVSTTAGTLFVTIPSNAAAAIPIGARIDILDMSSSSTTRVLADPAVTLQYNQNLVGGPSAVAGGAGASLTMVAPISKLVLYKTDTDSWAAFS